MAFSPSIYVNFRCILLRIRCKSFFIILVWFIRHNLLYFKKTETICERSIVMYVVIRLPTTQWQYGNSIDQKRRNYRFLFSLFRSSFSPRVKYNFKKKLFILSHAMYVNISHWRLKIKESSMVFFFVKYKFSHHYWFNEKFVDILYFSYV